GALREDARAPWVRAPLPPNTEPAPAVTSSDIVGPAAAAEDAFRATCLTPSTAPTIRRLAALAPRTLALMHGSSFTGDCAAALAALADDYARRLTAAGVQAKAAA